jgi:hypothetical protein
MIALAFLMMLIILYVTKPQRHTKPNSDAVLLVKYEPESVYEPPTKMDVAFEAMSKPIVEDCPHMKIAPIQAPTNVARPSLSEQRNALYNRPVEGANMQEYMVFPKALIDQGGDLLEF